MQTACSRSCHFKHGMISLDFTMCSLLVFPYLKRKLLVLYAKSALSTFIEISFLLKVQSLPSIC
jgi:hypothetical protein